MKDEIKQLYMDIWFYAYRKNTLCGKVDMDEFNNLSHTFLEYIRDYPTVVKEVVNSLDVYNYGYADKIMNWSGAIEDLIVGNQRRSFNRKISVPTIKKAEGQKKLF